MAASVRTPTETLVFCDKGGSTFNPRFFTGLDRTRSPAVSQELPLTQLTSLFSGLSLNSVYVLSLDKVFNLVFAILFEMSECQSSPHAILGSEIYCFGVSAQFRFNIQLDMFPIMLVHWDNIRK